MEQQVRSKGYENWLVTILAFLAGCVMFDRLVIVYLFPVMVPELGLQMWQVGAITSSLAIAWAVSAWIFGSVSDYRGRRTVLLPAIFLFSIVSWVTGIVSSFAQMVAVRALVGAAEGPVAPIATATLAEESTPTRRGFNIGAQTAMGPLFGMALGPVAAVQLAAIVGWRWSFFIVGIPGVVLGLILWKFLREPASGLRRRAARAVGDAPPQRATYMEVLKYRNIWLGSIFTILNFVYLFVLMTFGMLYLTNVHKVPMMEAGMAVAGFGMGAFFGLLVIPAISDHVGRKPAIASSALLAGLSLLGFVSVGADPGLLFLCLFFAGFFGSGTNIAYSTVPVESVPFHFAATAVAIPVTVGEILGSTVVPPIAGGLADAYGLQMAIYIAVGAILVAAPISLFFIETAPRVVARRTAKGASTKVLEPLG